MYLRGGHADDLAWARATVRRELGVASNIKTPSTGRAVRAALLSVQQRLRMVRTVPPNGLALFADADEVRAGEPGERAIDRKHYRCGDAFDTEQLERCVERAAPADLAVVAIDGGGCAVATVAAPHAPVVVASRTVKRWSTGSRRGGQSALRYARLREEQERNYLTLVAEDAASTLLVDGRPSVERIVVGGPGDKKHELLGRLPPELRALVVAVVTTDRTDLVALAGHDPGGSDAELGRRLERALLEDMAAYGPEAVARAVAGGYAETVLLPRDCRLAIRGEPARHWLERECPETGARLIETGVASELGVAALLRFQVGV